MEHIDKIFIVLLVLQGVYNLYQRVTGGNAAEKADAMPPAEEDDGTWALMLDRARERVAAARAQLAAHRARAAQLAERLAGPRVEPLRRAIEQRMLPQLDLIGDGFADLAALFAEPDEPADSDPRRRDARDAERMSDWASQAEELRLLLGRASRLVENLSDIEGAARWRDDARLGPILGDIDAVAASMLAPMANAARADRLVWPAGPPVTLPRVGDPGAMRALLAEHPVIFVDPDVADEQARWPAVIEAVARAALHTVPGLFEAGQQAIDPGVPAWLPRQQGRKVVFDPQPAAARWYEVLAVDTVAAVMMGPVAMRGLMHRLARPDDPFAVIRARAGIDHRTVGPEPPAHLRVALMAEVLVGQGYEVEARDRFRAWDLQHGSPSAISLPSLFGPAVNLPLARAMAPLLGPLTALATERHPALGDRSFSALGHFEMSPGLWGRARQQAARLVDDRPFNDSPRVVVAAAILAAEALGGFGPRLDRAVHRLITAPGERPPADPNYRPKRPDLGDPISARDLVEAVVLRAVLHRPHGGQQARRRL